MDPLRLLIVDQHPIVEEGLEVLLEEYPDIAVSATANSSVQGLELLRQIAVDVAVIGLNLPEMDVTEAIRLYLAENPELAIIIYSAAGEEASVFEALKAGARGYILKSSPVSQLVEAIREIYRGGYALSPSLSPDIIEFYLEHRGKRQGDQLAGYQMLTEREKQVFRLLALGKQTREIADILCISPKTVAKHRVAAKKKLDLENAVEMAQYALRLGLINVEGV